MRQDRRIFTSQKITKKIKRLFFSSVFILIFGMSSVLGAGYTCPTTKNYSSCNAGYYRVKSGSYYTCTACPSGYTSAGGSTVYTAASGACYIQTTAGKYIATANSSTQTTCPMGKYCPSTKVYYGSTGGIYDCPAASGSNIDTFAQMSTWPTTAFPDATSSNTTITASLSTWKTGITSKANCLANYTLKWNNGGTDLRKDSVPYNESLGRYATMVSGVEKGDRYIVKLSPGYYLTDCYSSTYCNTTTAPKYYKKAVACPAGSYCPGYTSMPLCSDTSHDYVPNNTLGLEACPALEGYTAKTDSVGSTSYLQCYLEENKEFSDAKGTYHYTEKCYYED